MSSRPIWCIATVVASMVARRRIWLVDDSALDAERARRALTGGYDVETFADGASALEQLSRRTGPDVLILDWVMPGVSGLDVCRFIRGSPNMPAALKILLLTAQNETAQIVEGLGSGADDYLAKPYADEELRARVAVLIRSQELVERVASAERTIRSLLDHAPDALVVVDVLGNITYANEEAINVLGTPVEDLLGRAVSDCIPGLDVGLAPAGSPLGDVTIGHRVFAPTVGHLEDHEGHRTTILLRDVTEQRRAEQRKLDFYSMVAHDLRSPLTAITLRTTMLLMGKRGLLPAEAMSDLRKLESNGRSMIALINDFLDLARMDDAVFKLTREELELGSLLDAAVEEFRPLAEVNRLTLRLIRPREEIAVLGDRPRLMQVLSNLISNAMKFTPADGTITVRVETTDDCAQVFVEDTGRGISRETLPTLFQRYVRADNVQGSVPGTGLGLMIVREIVEAHGGSVGVESSIGEGSTFWVRLPTRFAA